MRILVCGSRNWRDRGAIRAALWRHAPAAVILHGDCRGADLLAAEVARELGCVIEAYPPDLTLGSPRAYHVRNDAMLATNPDMVLAFGDGRGTHSVIRKAAKRGIPVHHVRVD